MRVCWCMFVGQKHTHFVRFGGPEKTVQAHATMIGTQMHPPIVRAKHTQHTAHTPELKTVICVVALIWSKLAAAASSEDVSLPRKRRSTVVRRLGCTPAAAVARAGAADPPLLVRGMHRGVARCSCMVFEGT